MPLDLILITNNIYKRKQKIDLVKVFNEEKIIEKKLKIKKTDRKSTRLNSSHRR